MNGRINHLMLNVNRYDEAKRFYGWLLPRLGYPNQTAYSDDGPKRGSGWYNDAGSVWVQEAELRFRSDQFHRHRVGLCEIAFTADSRGQVDELAAEIERHGGRVTEHRANMITCPATMQCSSPTPMASSWKWCTCHECCVRTARIPRARNSLGKETSLKKKRLRQAHSVIRPRRV